MYIYIYIYIYIPKRIERDSEQSLSWLCARAACRAVPEGRRPNTKHEQHVMTASPDCIPTAFCVYIYIYIYI